VFLPAPSLNHYEKILSRSHSNYLAQISIEMTGKPLSGQMLGSKHGCMHTCAIGGAAAALMDDTFVV
jgi:hypothetical protein